MREGLVGVVGTVVAAVVFDRVVAVVVGVAALRAVVVGGLSVVDQRVH